MYSSFSYHISKHSICGFVHHQLVILLQEFLKTFFGIENSCLKILSCWKSIVYKKYLVVSLFYILHFIFKNWHTSLMLLIVALYSHRDRIYAIIIYLSTMNEIWYKNNSWNLKHILDNIFLDFCTRKLYCLHFIIHPRKNKVFVVLGGRRLIKSITSLLLYWSTCIAQISRNT